MQALEIKNLSKSFGRLKAVDEVSFSVEQGEIFGFLGPNGAGKTTTIRCLMDFIRPDGGGIKIFGKDSHTDSVEIKKSVTYLPSSMQFYGSWTGQDHINYVESLRGKGVKTKEYIRRLDFDPKRKVRGLSTGNKQKLGLILALINQPKLLILDEPTNGLDPLLQTQIYQILSEITKEGSTVFMSTHNLHEVEENCSRVAIIKEGKLIATESVASLRQKHIYSVNISFEGEYKTAVFELPGVTIKKKEKKELVLNIRENINPLIKKLSSYSLKSLEIAPASLEEIFLEFYERD